MSKYEKRIVENFLRSQYTDERLAALLAHAEDGKLSYMSCCCFIGSATADHALRGRSTAISIVANIPGGVPNWAMPEHYREAKSLLGADAAEAAYFYLGDDDEERRLALIPIIRREVRRRERQRAFEHGKCIAGVTP